MIDYCYATIENILVDLYILQVMNIIVNHMMRILQFFKFLVLRANDGSIFIGKGICLY